MHNCGLCKQNNFNELITDDKKRYFDCLNCGLITLDPSLRLSQQEELARYKLHENSPLDPEYRAFLSRAIDPLLKYVQPGMRGLDYGCGPAPTTSVVLAEKGIEVTNYDPFFFPLELDDSKKYDFIICTEAIEHFYNPIIEFERMEKFLVKNDGMIVLMTEVLVDMQSLETWWYRRDPTHVSLYRDRVFEWISNRFGWKLSIPHKNVRVFEA